MKNKGFTLIELLVVIAIIGILASIVLVSLGSAREKARDAKRQSDIRQISLAMEMYYNDGQAYVATGTSPGSISSYLNPVPTDPGGGSDAGCNDSSGTAYQWVDNSSASSQYCMWACLENGNFFVASEEGTKEQSTEPTGLGDDCIQ